eukprot:521046-Alexandrium_andersonii.AAC.1
MAPRAALRSHQALLRRLLLREAQTTGARDRAALAARGTTGGGHAEPCRGGARRAERARPAGAACALLQG